MENKPNFIHYLGKKLTEYKETNHLSLKELGAQLDVESSYVHRIIKGERSNPSYQIVSKIIDVLKLDPIEVHEVALEKENSRMKDLYELLQENNLSTENVIDIVKLYLHLKTEIEKIESK